ncbi:semaphorin-5B-like [Rhopilema esculentum]|uniref:semaphorin-5B-like n=1 Tax=Rhopilema esculentum TaxID=499914 RepID=UPI0031D2FC98
MEKLDHFPLQIESQNRDRVSHGQVLKRVSIASTFLSLHRISRNSLISGQLSEMLKMQKSQIVILFLVFFLGFSSAGRRRWGRRRTPPPPPRVDGGWSGWGPFSGCNKACGGGVMHQYRHCNNPPPANGGSYCPGTNVNSVPCNIGGCILNGGWSGWGPFGACSKTCGSGVMHQYRQCNNPSPANGGSYCPGTNVNSVPCNTHSCPIDGGWSGWGSPQPCSKTCGGGVILRHRSCTNPSPANGGRTCPGSSTMPSFCNVHGCPEKPNSQIIMAPDGTKYQLVGCFDNSVDRLKEMLITERDHTSHVWNGEWVDWDNWNSYMENSLNRCAVKAHSKKFRVFGMSYYAECWVDRTVSNAMATFTPDLKDLSKCVKEGYKDCSMGDTRCIGKHYGIAVYQIIEK